MTIMDAVRIEVLLFPPLGFLLFFSLLFVSCLSVCASHLQIHQCYQSSPQPDQYIRTDSATQTTTLYSPE